jgi:hypothetical protein
VNGYVGQVVLLDHEMRAGAVYRAASLAALLVGREESPVRPERGQSASEPGLDGLDQREEPARPAEFLALDPADWAERLDAGTVPDTLRAAGLVPDPARPPALTEAITVANRLLDLRGLEPIAVTRVTRPESKGLLDRIFDR